MLILKAIKSISVGMLIQLGLGLAVQANTYGLWEGQSTHRERERIHNEIRQQQYEDAINRARMERLNKSVYFH